MVQFVNNNIQLFCGDCLKMAQMFKEKNIQFDAIITDPPYNISKENNFSTMRHKRQGVDFGTWDKNFDPCAWLDFYAPLVAKNGSVIIFCSYLYVSFIAQKLENLGFDVKDVLRWEKTNPMPRNINRRYVLDCELALWATKKGGKWAFNKAENLPYLRAKFKTAVVSGTEKLGHPTQKSLKLMREIIQIHTNPNDLVCDPFMGSGTTGAACKELNRRFVGVELQEDFFKLAKNRIDKIQTDDFCLT